jgi:Fe-S cluster biogenesis protein NfuA
MASAPVAATGRWKMLALMFVCSLPFFATYLAYFVIRPQGQAAYGELIDPVRPMPAYLATTQDGGKLALQELKKQWLLVVVDSGACGATCSKHLYLQRQLREMLGKDKDRVDRVWLIGDSQAVDPTLLAQWKDGYVLRVDQAILDTWFAARPGTGLQDYFFVVDPLGNTMMRMPADMDAVSAAKAKRDLERLLRASVSWDGAGR